MDRLIEIPVWVIFWLVFIGAIAGAFISPWVDSLLERWAKREDNRDSHAGKS